MFIRVGLLCRISYSVVSYLSFSGLITSVWEERAIFLLSVARGEAFSLVEVSSSSLYLE